MTLLNALRTKKAPLTPPPTLNFQVSQDIAAKLEDVAARTKVPRYDVCRLLIEQGLTTLIEELDNELPDLTPTPEYDEAGIAA
jgi:hypothetical protein